MNSISDERRLKGRQVLDQRRRVGEIENPGAAGPPRDHQPQKCLAAVRATRSERPRLPVAHQMLAPVALDPALDGIEQIGPHRLRTEIAAPDPSGDRVHQEQRHRRDDQQAGQVVDLLRPDLDEEEIEAPVGKIDQHRLARRVRAAIPAHERQQVVDAERDGQHRPFDAAERAGDALRIDLLPRRVERLHRPPAHPGRHERTSGARAASAASAASECCSGCGGALAPAWRSPMSQPGHIVTAPRRRRCGRRPPAP